MVHDAYYKREFIKEPKKKPNKTDRKVNNVVAVKKPKSTKTGKINTNIGHLEPNRVSSSKSLKSTSSSSSKATTVDKDDDEAISRTNDDDDEVQIITEEPLRTKKIPPIITIQKVSKVDKKIYIYIIKLK